MATKKLTDKQIQKARDIITGGLSIQLAADAVKNAVNEPTDAKVLKASLKELTIQGKAIERAIKILCPPKKVEA